MLELDHIAVAAETLEAGRAYVEDTLGVRLQQGGQHARFGTHNLLLGLEDGLYLEVIAVDPGAPDPGRPRWFDLDRFVGRPRIGNWICRCNDLQATVEALPQAGEPLRMTRDDLVWHMAVPRDGILSFDDAFPAIMSWGDTPHPAAKLTPSECRLKRMIVCHPQADELQQSLSGYLEDNRIVFETGALEITTEFDTPSGMRVLA